MSKKKMDKQSDLGLKDGQRYKMEPPKKYKVILYNDDYTSMEFVVQILEQLFHKSKVQATEIMLSVHNSGKGVAGVYTKEIAETKCSQVKATSIQYEVPLLAECEPE